MAEFSIHFDTVSKHRYLLYLRGFLRNDDGVCRTLSFASCADKNGEGRCWTHERDIESETHTSFEAYLKFDRVVDVESLNLRISIDGVSDPIDLNYQDVRRRTLQHRSYTIDGTWSELMKDEKIVDVLDGGRRARSGVTRKGNYFGKNVSVADIVSAPDVDYLGDVHKLSSVIPDDVKFDAFISIATFEHLLMPWKAAIEINKILKPGAVGLIVSHQTLGLHEVPWDFYRYSDEGWHGIFNAGTGFEVLDAGVCKPAMILPLVWASQFNNTEGAVGYLQSGAVVRKIGKPRETWRVSVDQILDSRYPH